MRQDRIGKENGEEMSMGSIPRPSLLRLRSQKTVAPLRMNGKGAGRVMAVVIFHGKATFVLGGISFSPLGDIIRSVAEW